MPSKDIYTVKELTAEQKTIIKDTIPVLKQAGEQLTATFYQNLFVASPETKIFFDETDQKNGRQPKILAFALLKYAENIDDLSPLVSFVEKIVSKHVGLQIKPEHYPLVGEALIGTMSEMGFKDPNFLEAWSQAYGNLAQLLINMENEYYKKQSWSGYKNFKVSKLVDECDDVKSVYFVPEDGSIAKPKPGQNITIRFNKNLARSYTISEISADDYRISVKKIGKVSTYIHEVLKVGQTVAIAPPSGDIHGEFDYFIIGGIGITSALTLLEEPLKSGRKVSLIWSNKSKNRPFVSFLKELKHKYENLSVIEYITREKELKNPIDSVKFGRVDVTDIIGKTLLVGPSAFIKDLNQKLLSQGVEPIIEYFGPIEV